MHPGDLTIMPRSREETSRQESNTNDRHDFQTPVERVAPSIVRTVRIDFHADPS